MASTRPSTCGRAGSIKSRAMLCRALESRWTMPKQGSSPSAWQGLDTLSLQEGEGHPEPCLALRLRQ